MEIISTDRNALSNGRVVGIEVDLKGETIGSGHSGRDLAGQKTEWNGKMQNNAAAKSRDLVLREKYRNCCIHFSTVVGRWRLSPGLLNQYILCSQFSCG